MLDLLLKNATVMDPSQDLNGEFDVAVQNGKIASIAPDVSESARETIDLSGKILTPGWVDIHAHVFAGATTWGIQADALCLSTGVTTIVDAGSPGWANFLAFRDFIAEPARTQILTFVHISGIGLTYGPVGEMEDMAYADVDRTAFVVHNWPEYCVGIKVRQGKAQVGENGVEPLKLAVQAGEMTNTPVMTHIGAGVGIADVLGVMRPGDIITHCFRGEGGTSLADALLDNENNVHPEVLQARKEGILFDVGHGGGSFLFEVAKQALARDFLPDVISTDLHAHSLNDPVFSLPETASKLLNLGIELPDIVRQTTLAPAQAIGRSDELGTLKEGTVADLAAFEIQEGQFEFHDVKNNLEVGNKKVEPVLTVRAGQVYRPADLKEELDETLRRAHEMKALMRRQFAELGWEPIAQT